MLVAAEDGIVVAEQLMEGIKGPAVSALAASLATRLRRAMEAAGVGASLSGTSRRSRVPCWWCRPRGHAGGRSGGADVNVGLVRLELLRAAEVVG